MRLFEEEYDGQSPSGLLFWRKIVMRIMCLAIFVFLFFFAAKSFAQDRDAFDGPRVFQAGVVAYVDYEKRLSRMGRNKGQTSLEKYALDIRNYNIGMSESSDEFVIFFSLKKLEDGMEVGGATYWIDKKSLKIANVVGFK